MEIALFGATGMIGSRVLAEATARGHRVRAIVRDPARSVPGADEIVVGDATAIQDVTAATRGCDAVVSAVGGVGDGRPRTVVDAAAALIAGLTEAGVDRLVVVGGAGSLETPEGGRLIDRASFPDAWRPGSQAQCDALDVYRASAGDLAWTFLSPPDEIGPGERTGRYTTGADALITDSAGRSRISAEDYAVALVDELEHGRHLRRRFTVAYS